MISYEKFEAMCWTLPEWPTTGNDKAKEWIRLIQEPTSEPKKWKWKTLTACSQETKPVISNKQQQQQQKDLIHFPYLLKKYWT